MSFRQFSNYPNPTWPRPQAAIQIKRRHAHISPHAWTNTCSNTHICTTDKHVHAHLYTNICLYNHHLHIKTHARKYIYTWQTVHIHMKHKYIHTHTKSHTTHRKRKNKKNKNRIIQWKSNGWNFSLMGLQQLKSYEKKKIKPPLKLNCFIVMLGLLTLEHLHYKEKNLFSNWNSPINSLLN